VKGKSSTEKLMAGILLDYAKTEHLALSPKIFDDWLDHLTGWAEVDVLCTGKFTIKALPTDSKAWAAQLKKFSKSRNISKRRASLVFLCSPLRYYKDEVLVSTAFANIEQLKSEKEILITKAISWLLRSMVKLYKKEVTEYIRDNKLTLPSIAVRETLKKIDTGKKT
jgi:3-methyladenine DNA glycosylase AlkD